MGILQKITNRNKETYKIFGITVCKIIKNYDFKYKSVLGIFHKTKKYHNSVEKRTIKLCNMSITERIESLDSIEYKILNFNSNKINKVEATTKNLRKIIDKKYNKVFILKSNLGEAYLFLKYILNGLIEKTDKPLIIATKKYHLNLINMIVPNIDKKLVQSLKYETNKKIYTVDNQQIYVAFPMKFYIDTEEKIKQGNCHYLSEMYNFFRISRENILNTNKIKISIHVEKLIDDYLEENNIDKFIFLSTDATTCESIDSEFWDKLEEQLKIKIIRNKREMTIEEAYYLAQKSVATITLRSGLSEILADVNNLHIILYTKFKKRYRFDVISEMKVSKGYSIQAIEPNRKNIYEIGYSEKSRDEIIKWITDIVNMRVKVK